MLCSEKNWSTAATTTYKKYLYQIQCDRCAFLYLTSSVSLNSKVWNRKSDRQISEQHLPTLPTRRSSRRFQVKDVSVLTQGRSSQHGKNGSVIQLQTQKRRRLPLSYPIKHVTWDLLFVAGAEKRRRLRALNCLCFTNFAINFAADNLCGTTELYMAEWRFIDIKHIITEHLLDVIPPRASIGSCLTQKSSNVCHRDTWFFNVQYNFVR